MAERSSTNSPPEPTAGFVLAGGRSRRMGRDKASLPWGPGTLLQHMSRLLLTATKDVRVVGREELPDRVPNLGPLGGILTALTVSDNELNIVVAVDLPLLTPAFVQMLKQRLATTSRDIVACRVQTEYPLCLGLRPAVLPVVTGLVENGALALHQLIESASSEIVSEDELRGAGFDSTIFWNLNTPGDWKRAREKYRKTEGIT